MLNWFFTDTPLRFFIQSFWRDEAFSYLLAKKSLVDIIFLNAQDFSPPLYSLILNIWVKLFGISEIALRSFSLITFVAVLYVVYLFLTDIFKIKIKWAYVYLLLFLFNPFLLYYAFEARAYMLFVLFALLSFYYLYQFRPVKYCVVVLLGLLTHYFMFLVIATQVVFALTARSYRSRDKLFQLKTTARPVLLFVPWFIFVFSQYHFDGKFWIEKPPLEKLFQLPAIIYLGYETRLGSYEQWLIPISLFLLAIVAYGVWKITSMKYTVATKERRDLLYMFLSWSLLSPLLVFAVSFVYPIFFPRYLIFAGLGLVLLMVFLIEQIDQKMRWIFFAALLLLSLHFNSVQVQLRTKAPIRETVKEIKAQMTPGDLIYVTSELNFHPAQYYLDEKRVFIYGKTYEQIPQYVGKVLIPQNKITNSLPIYPNKAFILKSDLTYDIQSIY